MTKKNMAAWMVKLAAFIFLSTNAYAAQTANIAESLEIRSVKQVTKEDLMHPDAKSDKSSPNDIDIKTNSIAVERNGVTNLNGKSVIKTNGMLSTFTNGSILNFEKSYIINANEDVRFSLNRTSIGYLGSILYDASNNSIDAKRFRIISSKNISFVSENIASLKDGLFRLRNNIFTSCPLDLEEIKQINTYRSSNVNEEDIPKSDKYKSIEHDFNMIKSQHTFLPWSGISKNATYNVNTGVVNFKHLILRVFGLPVFYTPSFSHQVVGKKEGKSGFMIPMPIIMGTRQLGLNIPFYVRISHNQELLINALLFTKVRDRDSGEYTGPRSVTDDVYRLKSNHIKFAYKYLISKKYDNESFVSLKGSITERTQVIDHNSRVAAIRDDGSIMHGYRGHIRAKGQFMFSNTTIAKFSYLYVTDPNYMFWYMRKQMQHHRNFIELRDTRDRSFNQIEIVSWTPMLLNFFKPSAPEFMPRFRSFYRTKADKNGGRFFSDIYAEYFSRSHGYGRALGSITGGYEVNKVKLGSMFNASISVTGNGYNMTHNGSIFTGYSNTNIMLKTFGGYNGLMGFDPYIHQHQTGTSGFALINAHISWSKPLFRSFDWGVVIINPKATISNSYGTNPDLFSTNENSLGTRLIYQNLFEANRMFGYDAFDAWPKASAGIESSIITASGYKIGIGSGISYRITMPTDHFITPGSGVHNNLSDYVGMVKFSSRSERVTLINNHRINSSNGNLMESNTILNTELIFNRLSVGVMHSYFNSDALFIPGYNFESSFLSLFGTIRPTERITITGMVGRNMGKSGTYMNGRVVASDPAWIFVNVTIMHHIGCIAYGLGITSNLTGLPGTQNQPMFKFKLKIVGF